MGGGFQDMVTLRVPQVEVGGEASAPGREWVKGEFLKGPIPMSWLEPVCHLKGQKVLAVALAIWFLAGLRRRREGLQLTSKVLQRFDVDNRSAKYRALNMLEQAGLISVERRPRRNPLVTILEVG